MQLLLVEGRGDAISRLALTLQPFCGRWQGLDQENPLRCEGVKRQIIFEKVLVLLWEEN